MNRSGLLLACLLIGAASLAHAAVSGAAAPAAISLARQIDTHYDHLRSLQVHFSQSYDGMGMHRQESGILLLTKAGRLHGGRMRWTYSQPAGKLFVFNGKEALFYTPGQSEVQRISATQLDDLRSPLSLLLGHADLPEQLLNLSLTPAENGEQTLSGVPRSLQNRVSSLELTADASGVIRRMSIQNVDGSRSTFLFSDEQPDVPVPASAFTFTPPPGTHIVEGMPPI